MAKNRGERVNEEMKKTLAAIVFDMKDPRISPMTTITEAEVTNDLKYCKVSVSVYDTDENARKETVAALNRAAGHIGWEVCRRMQIRAIPKFKFTLDESIAYSVHISDLINRLHIPHEEEGEQGTPEA